MTYHFHLPPMSVRLYQYRTRPWHRAALPAAQQKMLDFLIEARHSGPADEARVAVIARPVIYAAVWRSSRNCHHARAPARCRAGHLRGAGGGGGQRAGSPAGMVGFQVRVHIPERHAGAVDAVVAAQPGGFRRGDGGGLGLVGGEHAEPPDRVAGGR